LKFAAFDRPKFFPTLRRSGRGFAGLRFDSLVGHARQQISCWIAGEKSRPAGMPSTNRFRRGDQRRGRIRTCLFFSGHGKRLGKELLLDNLAPKKLVGHSKARFFSNRKLERSNGRTLQSTKTPPPQLQAGARGLTRGPARFRGDWIIRAQYSGFVFRERGGMVGRVRATPTPQAYNFRFNSRFELVPSFSGLGRARQFKPWRSDIVITIL